MRALILGSGSIGSRHAHNLKRLDVEVFVADIDAARAERLAVDSGATVVDRRSAPAVDLVVVATPTVCHSEDLAEALARGAHVFVEKPLAHDDEALSHALASAAAHPDRRVMVGCNLRFTEGFRLLRAAAGMSGHPAMLLADFGWWLPAWRPGGDYRRQYSARRALGGGIILDAIHEIDYSLVLAGPAHAIRAVWSRSGLLEVDVDDVADITLRHDGGAQSHIHVDYLRRRYSRSCVMVSTDAEITWDVVAGVVTLRREPGGDVEVLGQDLDASRNQQYVDEMRDMLDAIASRREPINGIEEAAATTRVALEALSTGRE